MFFVGGGVVAEDVGDVWDGEVWLSGLSDLVKMNGRRVDGSYQPFRCS